MVADEPGRRGAAAGADDCRIGDRVFDPDAARDFEVRPEIARADRAGHFLEALTVGGVGEVGGRSAGDRNGEQTVLAVPGVNLRACGGFEAFDRPACRRRNFGRPRGLIGRCPIIYRSYFLLSSPIRNTSSKNWRGLIPSNSNA
jgi:hypothetical protein